MERGSAIDVSNHEVYADPGVIAHYARGEDLQPAEKVIFGMERETLSRATLLDIGVGGGRTTKHLGPRVRRYVGVDYSRGMIAAASARFASEAYEFVVGDARRLPHPDGSFDFVVFSHNGIDYVGHEDRLAILAEIRRVLAPAGRFVFSTHNLDRNDLRFEVPEGENFLLRLWRARQTAKLRAHNPGHRSFPTRAHAMVNDGAFDFRAATYHIRVPAQIAQLAAAGFADVRTFSGVKGDERSGTMTDPWVYFACRRA